jgi:hypothetical protein
LKRALWWSAAVGVIFVTAIALNFLWEMSQGQLFALMGLTLAQGMWRCFRASLGDGVIVLVIAVIVGLGLRRADWFLRPRWVGYVLMEAVGIALAVALEWVSLREGRWSYRDAMPLIPGLQVGALPVLQMAVLPPLIFRIAASLLNRKSR